MSPAFVCSFKIHFSVLLCTQLRIYFYHYLLKQLVRLTSAVNGSVSRELIKKHKDLKHTEFAPNSILLHLSTKAHLWRLFSRTVYRGSLLLFAHKSTVHKQRKVRRGETETEDRRQ
jgi:hypothetical protein